jgi:NADH:ubiquinone oxidoreductase subunit E
MSYVILRTVNYRITVHEQPIAVSQIYELFASVHSLQLARMSSPSVRIAVCTATMCLTAGHLALIIA